MNTAVGLSCRGFSPRSLSCDSADPASHKNLSRVADPSQVTPNQLKISFDGNQRSIFGKPDPEHPPPARSRPVSGHIPRFFLQMRINANNKRHGRG